MTIKELKELLSNIDDSGNLVVRKENTFEVLSEAISYDDKNLVISVECN